ncbi:MAG: GTP cyclohydrolase I FolE [Ardenticatenaceae bacterium]|nr:GTP cyclohydrolase I FolE [Ardenticatenaceae bacterium]
MLNSVKELNGYHQHEPEYRNGHANGKANGKTNGAVAHHDETKEAKQAIETAVRTILTNVGEDPDREGLIGTPDRIARMYDEILAGYTTDPVKLVNGALFDVEYDDPVIVKEIEYFSMCEHHMLPFFGRAHIAYIPSDKVIGLSKIPRIVEMFARRLQVQERMTRQIAEMIDEVLKPQGVAVVVEGSHMCSMMRGVKKEHPRMMTSYMIGKYKEDKELRREFMDQLRK